MNPIIPPIRRSAALFAALLGDFTLSAQTVRAPAETAIALDPFTVTASAEESYQASGAASASKFNRPIKDIPHSVAILNESFLRDITAASLTEALPFAGADRSNPVRGAEAYNVRGFGIGVNFTDGVRDGQAFAGGEMAHVQQVELIKGPASNLYGPNRGLGGVINRVTKKPLEQEKRALSLTVGSEDFYRTTLDLTGPISQDKSWLYRVNFAYQQNASFRDMIDFKQWFVSPVITKRLGPRTNATLYLEFLEQRTEEDVGFIFVRPTPTGPLVAPAGVPFGRNFGEPWENTKISKQVGRLIFTHAVSASWTGRLVASQSYYNNPIEHVEAVSVSANQRVFNRQAFWLNRWEDWRYLSADLVGRFTTGPARHQLLVGVDKSSSHGRSNVRRTALAPIDIYNPVYVGTKPNFNVPATTNSLFNSGNPGAYVSDQISFLGDKIQFVGGLRRDKSTGDTAVELTPRTFSIEPTVHFTAPQYGALVRALPHVTLYAQYSESFRPIPGTSRGLDGNGLRPEIGDITEFGLKTTWFNSALEFDVATFEINNSNQAVRLAPPNNSFFANAGSTRGEGAEIRIGFNISNFNLLAGWTYVDRYETTPGLAPSGVTGIAKNQAQIFGKYRFTGGTLGGLTFGGGAIWLDHSRRLTTLTDTLPGYLRADLFASYRFNRSTTATLNIYNVFDKRYWAGGGSFNIRPGEPLSLRCTVRRDF